jgi:hypothetical protein
LLSLATSYYLTLDKDAKGCIAEVQAPYPSDWRNAAHPRS